MSAGGGASGNGASTGGAGEAGGIIGAGGASGSGGIAGSPGGAGGMTSFMNPCVPAAATISDLESGYPLFSSDGCTGVWSLSTDGSGSVTIGAATPASVTDQSSEHQGNSCCGKRSGKQRANAITRISVRQDHLR